ncbi:hypothetical protein DAI22_09g050400 [Oryza sativa Japonica Group]|nr:hypothetical protein DAI22_09g050400 [Oryza sativa Japonica Group]
MKYWSAQLVIGFGGVGKAASAGDFFATLFRQGSCPSDQHIMSMISSSSGMLEFVHHWSKRCWKFN